ncbi:MAG: HAD family hydrolase [Deltaproteobacteria bacterium]|jgi:HAD superfamily hydrolase (TIGR01509 family)|nr:HAD family hydrolase [Deltaproteobacteria bacterium]
MPLKYAIFDFDMTLVDSIKPLMTSANLLAHEFGLAQVTYQQVYLAEISVPNCTFEKLWTQLWGHYEPAWYQAYADHLTEPEYQAMELFEGGRETLEALNKGGVIMGLASNRDTPDKPLRTLGILDYFKAIVGQLDVKNVKPAPDMILKAMELLGARPEQTLYVCDSKGDLVASQAAGVKAMAMTTGGHSKEELLALGAFKTGDKLTEVLSLFGQ